MPDINQDFRGHSRGQNLTLRMLEGTLSADGVLTNLEPAAADRPPAGAIVLGARTIVEVPLSGGGVASYTLGDPGDADRWGASPGAGAELVKDYVMGVTQVAAAPLSSATPYVLRITLNAAATAGRIRWTVYYLDVVGPAVFNAGT